MTQISRAFFVSIRLLFIVYLSCLVLTDLFIIVCAPLQADTQTHIDKECQYTKDVPRPSAGASQEGAEVRV